MSCYTSVKIGFGKKRKGVRYSSQDYMALGIRDLTVSEKFSMFWNQEGFAVIPKTDLDDGDYIREVMCKLVLRTLNKFNTNAYLKQQIPLYGYVRFPANSPRRLGVFDYEVL